MRCAIDKLLDGASREELRIIFFFVRRLLLRPGL